MSLVVLNLGVHTEGLLLGHLSIRGPLLLHPTLSPQVEVRQAQANVLNQMLMITSDSQKHRGQVAFLSVRLAHPALGLSSPGRRDALLGLGMEVWGQADRHRMHRPTPGHGSNGMG